MLSSLRQGSRCRRCRRSGGILCLSILLGVVPSLAADLPGDVLRNGGFESGAPCPDGSRTLDAGSTDLAPWLVSSGQVELVCSLWISAEGQRSVELNGGVPGALEQTIATEPGRPYLISFNISGDPEGPLETKFLRLTVAGEEQDFFHSVSGRSRSDMGWSFRSLQFYAEGVRTTLRFQSLNVESSHGPALDNVRVFPVDYPF